MTPTGSSQPNAVISSLENPSVVDVLNHEIRTPLAILMGHAEVLEDLDLGDQAAHSVTVIAEATARLAKIAETLSRLADSDAADADFLQLRSQVRQSAPRPWGRRRATPVDGVSTLRSLVLAAGDMLRNLRQAGRDASEGADMTRTVIN